MRFLFLLGIPSTSESIGLWLLDLLLSNAKEVRAGEPEDWSLTALRSRAAPSKGTPDANSKEESQLVKDSMPAERSPVTVQVFRIAERCPVNLLGVKGNAVDILIVVEGGPLRRVLIRLGERDKNREMVTNARPTSGNIDASNDV